MGKYGINAPPGIAIQNIEDLLPAAKKLADADGEVCTRLHEQHLQQLEAPARMQSIIPRVNQLHFARSLALDNIRSCDVNPELSRSHTNVCCYARLC